MESLPPFRSTGGQRWRDYDGTTARLKDYSAVANEWPSFFKWIWVQRRK
jgi:hypothetical protein